MASARILVVEDDLHTRNIIEMVLKRDRMLRYHQLEVICAGDGEEGLRLFHEHAPDVLITDLLMPKLDGFELVKAVRASPVKGDLPILATSAIVRDKSVLRRLERDYDVQLQLKPFSPKVLAGQIRRILQGLGGDAGEPLVDDAEDLDERALASDPAPRPGPSVARPSPDGDPLSRSPSTPERAMPGLAPPSRPFAGDPGAPKKGAVSTQARAGGDLTQTTLARVLLDAFEGQWIGTLDVRSGQVRKLIHLIGGYPIFVRSNLRNETLGQLLVKRGGITEAQHEQVIRQAQQQGLRYGEALVRLKLLTEEEVMAELVAQTRYKVQSCLRWREGAWSFSEDPEIGAKVPRCTVDPLDVLFSGLRRHHSVEEAISLLRSRGSRTHIIRLPRFDLYRDRFAESFGWDLVELIGTGCPLSRLSEARGKQDLAVQLDVMLQTGMVELRERPIAPLVDHPSQQLPPDARPGSASGGLARIATGPQFAEGRPSGEMLSLKNLALPTGRAGGPASEREADRSSERVPKRRIETPEIRMARQLIEATYLGLHEKTHYEVLGVIPGTDAAGIEVAYHVKRKQFDLERFRGMDLGTTYGHLEEICAALDSAFGVLSDPDQRRTYNEALLTKGSELRDRAMRAEELFRAGCDLLEQSRYDDALYALEEATKLDDQAEYRAQEALAYFMAGGQGPEVAAEAMVRVHAALAADPQQPRSHLVAARISYGVGAIDEAIGHLQEAIGTDPTFASAFDELERILLETHQTSRLEEEYRRTIFLVGNSDRAWAAVLWRRLSSLYRDRLGDEQKAYVAAEAALKLNPKDSGLRAVLAQADAKQADRWPDAVRGYRMILARDPSNHTAVHRIFELHQKAGRLDAAFLAASAAISRGVAESEELRLVSERRGNGLRRGEKVLTEHVLEGLRHPHEDRVLSGLFARLSQMMMRLDAITPEQLGAASDATSPPTAPKLFDELLRYVCYRLGIDVPVLRLRDTADVWIGLSSTEVPLLLVTTDALLIADERELCFRLARALAPLRARSMIARLTTEELLRDYLYAVVKAVARERDVPALSPRGVELQRHLQREPELVQSCAGMVAALFDRGGGPDPARWLEGTRRSAERVGLILCVDLIVACKVVAERGRDAESDLLEFALSEEHERLRRQLGTAIV